MGDINLVTQSQGPHHVIAPRCVESGRSDTQKATGTSEIILHDFIIPLVSDEEMMMT